MFDATSAKARRNYILQAMVDREQAAFVLKRMQTLIEEEGVSPSGIAVLYRSHYQSLELQMELTRRLIPYEIRSIEDLNGLRVYMFPTGGQFMQQFGVVPVALPYEDVEVAIQTGELDGVCWCGITEMYTVGWADVLKYYLTNNISGAWAGSYFVNTERWNALPPHLQELFKLSIDNSHYYRAHWYWWGEAHYRTTGGKLELTSIPDAGSM